PVVHHAHQVGRTGEPAHRVLRGVERVDALGLARDLARERAVARADLEEHGGEREMRAQAAQLALGVARAALEVRGVEPQPARGAAYQHRPSYTPATER